MVFANLGSLKGKCPSRNKGWRSGLPERSLLHHLACWLLGCPPIPLPKWIPAKRYGISEACPQTLPMWCCGIISIFVPISVSTARLCTLPSKDRSAVHPSSMPLSHRNVNRTISWLKKCLFMMWFQILAFHVLRWHRKMKNLTSLDYSSYPYDDTNYIV